MTKEFNLSDNGYNSDEDGVVYEEKYVKEFIKRLKEKLINPKEYQCGCCSDNEEIIDKLAGNKLI